MSLLQSILFRIGLRRAPDIHAFGDPVFTIIIPTKNPGPKLRASLDSITSQQGATFEILVIDGNSTDGTAELVAGHDGPIRFLPEDRPGVYTAMNLGLREAKGAILYFLGSGDRLRPDILRAVGEAWPKSGEIFFYGDVWMEDLVCLYDGEFTTEKLRKKNICHQAIFYSRAIFKRHGPYEESYQYLADYAFNLRAFGDSAILKRYVPWVIADYEGDGLSANHPDIAFQAAKASLCDQFLGPRKRTDKAN